MRVVLTFHTVHLNHLLHAPTQAEAEPERTPDHLIFAHSRARGEPACIVTSTTLGIERGRPFREGPLQHLENTLDVGAQLGARTPLGLR